MPSHRLLFAALLFGIIASSSMGCGTSQALTPAARTFDAVTQCVQAFESATDVAEVLQDAGQCAPVALQALGAWCKSGVIKGGICDALSPLASKAD